MGTEKEDKEMGSWPILRVTPPSLRVPGNLLHEVLDGQHALERVGDQGPHLRSLIDSVPRKSRRISSRTQDQ